MAMDSLMHYRLCMRFRKAVHWKRRRELHLPKFSNNRSGTLNVSSSRIEKENASVSVIRSQPLCRLF